MRCLTCTCTLHCFVSRVGQGVLRPYFVRVVPPPRPDRVRVAMALSKLSRDEQGIILGQLRNTLEPRLAMYFSSASKELRALLPLRLRQLPQLAASAAEGHGDARVERVAQLDEDDALLVTAQLGERHRDARGGARASRGDNARDRARSSEKVGLQNTTLP